MASVAHNQGARIRHLFSTAHKSILIVAPFIKMEALKYILQDVRPGVQIKCTTRWMPKEIALGVSDPEIFDLLEERGHSVLTLVDQLHAKIYIADSDCLVGSANVTQTALGTHSYNKNIELLVDSNTDNDDVDFLLKTLNMMERRATKEDAKLARFFANQLESSLLESQLQLNTWIPKSRKPDLAYSLYRGQQSGFMRRSVKLVLEDIAAANVQPGLDEAHFHQAIRSRLSELPPAKQLLENTEDRIIQQDDVAKFFKGYVGDEYTVDDLWNAFVSWMAYFFKDQVMRQDIASSALRRAKQIDTPD